MKYKLVIFDWDGTLMDSVGRIVSSMQAAASLSGQLEPNVAAVKNIIGLSLEVAVARLFPDAGQQQQHVVFTHYKDQYSNHNQTPTPLFAGADTLLRDLNANGYKLAVATGKGRQGLQRVLHQSGVADLFHGTRSADEAQSKPSPDMLQQLLHEMQFDNHQAVMIGDSEYDMKMARAMNMDRIGVSFGVHDTPRLLAQRPLTVIDQLSELRAWL
jgi:phosphoglycolate phosphatase